MPEVRQVVDLTDLIPVSTEVSRDADGNTTRVDSRYGWVTLRVDYERDAEGNLVGIQSVTTV